MKNKIIKNKIVDHYQQADLGNNITTAFDRAGCDIRDYNDTEVLDEFHIRGRKATRELARLAGFQKGMRVLDLGCGIGGPARMLAAEFGCDVMGVDLVDEYCNAATMITQRIGLSHMVRFRQGDITEPIFGEKTFDAAWTLHTLMNIENKATLFDSVSRILKPGGVFALYEICEGSNAPPHFPVPWASDASMGFLLKANKLQQRISKSGFMELQWVDVSSAALKWFQAMADKRAASDKTQSKETSPNISLLLGKTAAEKSKNVFLNLKEDRIRTVFGVFQKPGTSS